MDPDLLVFGKHFTSNVWVLPHHYSRINASEPLASDKRQFVHPPPPHPPPPPPATTPYPAFTAGGQPSSTTSQQAGSEAFTAATSTASSPSTLDGPYVRSSTWPGQVNSETPPTYPTTSAQALTSPSLDHTFTIAPVTIKGSHQPPNPTTGSFGRNHTPASEADQAGGGVGALDPGWSSSAQALLLPVVVVLVVVITVLLSCCCSILLVVSWRDQRKWRMGRYRTLPRGRRGSTRLIKYVLVRENN